MRRCLALLALLAPVSLAGCEGGDPPAPEEVDADADGFEAASDCDDASAAIHPGAPEICNGIDEDCDGELDEDPQGAPSWFLDSDGDGSGAADPVPACAAPLGHVLDGSDCDDTDGDVHPGAAETCDGIDQDCDGEVDEDPEDGTPWYPDADGDGIGAEVGEVVACSAPGHVGTTGDCDDGDPGVHPGADEVCDGLDQDCDGAADEGTPGLSPFHPDADGDGFGDPSTGTLACEAPPGHLADATDCDDDDASVHPGAADTCGDARDEDCDGEVDEGEDADGDGAASCGDDCDDDDPAVHPGAGETCDGADQDCDGKVDEGLPGGPWYVDLDGDGYGDPDRPVEGCAGPPDGAVADAGDCDDLSAEVRPGGAEACGDGLDGDCDGRDPRCGPVGEIDLHDADALLAGREDDQVGAVAAAGDVDGDGYGDVLIGADHRDRAYLMRGPLAGRIDLAEADLTFGPAEYSYGGSSEIGTSVAGGDLDGDGLADLLVGAPHADEGGYDTGSAYVLFGPASGWIEPADAGAVLSGTAQGAKVGASVAVAGDVDGDGHLDVLVGAPSDPGSGNGGGAAYLLLGPVTGDRSLGTADARLLAEEGSDRAGTTVASAGDVDGDGYGDILVSAPYSDAGGRDSGRAYLFLGPVTGEASLASADVTLTGAAEYAYLGPVAGAGDTDGDGYDDVLVRANIDPLATGYQGIAYLFRGPIAPDATLADADARLVGEHGEDLAGQLAGAGDVNGDGFADLLVGAQYSDRGGDDSGAAYLCYGPLAGSVGLGRADARFAGERTLDYAGIVAGGGDVDGDGYGDFLVAAPGNDEARAGGAVYVVLGGEAEDLDGDGLSARDGDCVDRDPLAFPGAEEACNGVDDDCDGEVDEGPDADGDGAAPCDGDCDDGDPAVGPGVVDVCNGVDDDCDGMPDQDDDLDRDGWAPCVGDCDDGDPRVYPGAPELCDDRDTDCDGVLGEAPDLDGDGSAVCDGDCDDLDPAVGPESVEICDGVDQDCDGVADDDFDRDADSWRTCDGDCDDTRAAVFPGAPEGCDGIDSDCDGDVDEGALDDADGDGHTVCDGDCDDGDPLAYPGAPSGGCPGDGCLGEPDGDGDGWSECMGDCDDADPARHPGALETCGDGVDQDCDPAGDGCAPEGELSAEDVPARWGRTGTYTTGAALAPIGDLDGDGSLDFIVGDPEGPSYHEDYPDPGCAWIFLGPFDLGAEFEPRFDILGKADGDRAGASVAGPGDVDGDGFADFLIGAPDDSTSASGAGAAYLFRGPSTVDRSVEEADGAWLGEGADDAAGSVVAAAGDVNGDGLGDFLVTAPRWDGEGSYTGAAYLILGPGLGTSSLAWADARWTGSYRSHSLESVAGAGDVDGDGYDDVLVGALGDDAGGYYAGAAFLFYGPVHGDLPLEDADARLMGPGEYQGAGRVAGAGDVNGDGYADVLVGGPYSSPTETDAGTAWLVHGPIWGDFGLEFADARFEGSQGRDFLGAAMAGVGDVDGDGLDDLAFGASEHDAAESSAGAAWLVYSPVSGAYALGSTGAVVYGSDWWDSVGAAVAGGGDLDGDGYDDVLVGAPTAAHQILILAGGGRP
ncbi:FG-GAP-like repeat-containing protein [Myxococcota bacterium]|nr:FG-GAP-like repeat-containing protein [Myxococcota bacterium]